MIQNKAAQLIIDANTQHRGLRDRELTWKWEIDCLKFFQTDLYTTGRAEPSRECISVCHSLGLNLCFVVLYFLFLRQCGQPLCVRVSSRDEDIFHNIIIIYPPKTECIIRTLWPFTHSTFNRFCEQNKRFAIFQC